MQVACRNCEEDLEVDWENYTAVLCSDCGTTWNCYVEEDWEDYYFMIEGKVYISKIYTLED